MKSVNRAVVLGNLGKNPEVKYTTGGKAVTQISVATNERFKNKKGEWEDHAEWHTVVIWEKLAEIAGEYLKKGDKVYIEGRLKTSSWEKDGETKYRTDIIATGLVLLGSKHENASKAVSDTPAGRPITDEDIPF